MRSGTLATPLIVGFGEACRVAKEEMNYDHQHISNLYQRLYHRITSSLTHVHLNGSTTHRYPGNLNLSFAGVEPYTALVFVSNQTQQIDLHLGTDYTVNYVDRTVNMIPGGNVNAGDIIVITAYEIGGGNQLYKAVYNGADIGNSVTVPVAYYQIDGVTPEIQEFVIFVNGVITTNYTYAPTGQFATTVTFGTTYTFTDSITLYVLAPTITAVGNIPVNYSWSAPQTQIINAIGSGLSFTLDNSLIFTNPECLIVTVNGVRARTAGGIRHVGDGSTAYTLPDRLGFNQSIIADNQVKVYINSIPQTLGTDFVVEPYDGTVREVIFATEPAIGSEILIYVTTNVQCYVNGDQLVFNAGSGL
ncbi:MAG: aminotransferase class V-fold PLP-dependent enzyme, partial [Micrococcales bacterium]|nr:aminotransferase class V-fold PLP-dependent enzyme [Micrococcales bacterium]